MKNKYGQLIKDLKAKNFTDSKIKEAILEKAKKEINHFNFNFKGFKVKTEGEEEKKVIEIEGYASTKDIDRYGDVVEPTAFDDTMELFMKNPVLLLQHDHNKRIGDVTEYKIDKTGLYIKADVKYNAGDEELFDKIEGKSLKGFSIGWRILEAEWLEGDDNNWLFVVKKLDLVEISVVNVPANPYTLMKSIEDLAIKSFETLAKEVDEEEGEEEKEEIPGDDENANDNQDDNQEENENNNDNEEKEKDLKVEIKDDKVDDPEADNDGGDIEDEAEDEEIEDEEKDTEEENEDKPEEKKIDGEEEKDNIENEDEVIENQPETEDGKETDNSDEKDFTTKFVEKIVEAKISGNEKTFKDLLTKEVKTLTKFWTKELEAVKSNLEKEVDLLVELVKEVKATESEIVERIKSTVKGKWFINFKTTEEKKVATTRLEKILEGVKNKQF